MSTEDTASGTRSLWVVVAGGSGAGHRPGSGLRADLGCRAHVDPAQFGAFSALLALLLIGNTVALAAQAVAAHDTSSPRIRPIGLTRPPQHGVPPCRPRPSPRRSG